VVQSYGFKISKHMKYIRIYCEPTFEYLCTFEHIFNQMSSNLKPIDFNHLDAIANGDENFKKELINIFLEQIPDFVKNMKSFLENDNYEKLAREAHTAKSSALIFGMSNAGKLLKEIQFLAETKNKKDIIPALKLVEYDFETAAEQLQDYLK